jgi:hypothetical protein
MNINIFKKKGPKLCLLNAIYIQIEQGKSIINIIHYQPIEKYACFLI